MENAVKALLIAGAVFIVILLISLGIRIYNEGAGKAQNVNLDEYEIREFNEKFRKYEGKNVSASDVNELVKTAFYHNSSYKDDESMRVRVCLNGGGNWQTDEDNEETGGKFLVLLNNFYKTTNIRTVPAGYRYYVKTKINENTRLIEQIDVETLEYAKEKGHI